MVALTSLAGATNFNALSQLEESDALINGVHLTLNLHHRFLLPAHR